MTPRERDLDPVFFNHHKLRITRLDWPDGALSFDVYHGDGCLTEMESLDDHPGEADLARLMGWASNATLRLNDASLFVCDGCGELIGR